MNTDSSIYALADSLGVSPFVTLALCLTVAVAAVALFSRLLSDLDSGLPPGARWKLRIARRNETRNNAAAIDRPRVWRRQVAAEGSVYVQTLRAQLRAEHGSR